MTASPLNKFFRFAFALILIASAAPALAESSMDSDALPPSKKEKAVKADVGDVSEEELETNEVAMQAEAAPATLTPEIEGAGLYIRPGDGTLGKDLWENMPRSVIIKLLTTMPANSRYPAQQKMIMGVLLSQTNIRAIQEDTPPTADQDLLTLRLRKLIEAGAYQQALDLYSSLELENPPAGIAKEAIIAMLLTAQKGLACVELNSLGDAIGSNEFYKNLKIECNTPSADTATKKEYLYTTEIFDALSTYEKALIVANDTIKIGETVDRNFKKTPPSHIQILMHATNLTPEDKFTLNVRALDWGLISEESFTKIYKAAIDPDERLDPELKVPENAADWEKLPYYLQLATNQKNDEQRWAYIKAAFPAAHKYGLSALSPFAELIYKVKPRDVTFEEMKTSAHILSAGIFTIPPQWIDIIEKYNPSANDKKEHAKLLAAVYVASKGHSDDSLKQRIYKEFPLDTASSTFIIKNIIENIDIGIKETHNPVEIYDNDNNLTYRQDYVMPSMVLWNRLQVASQEKLAGETVLLSAAALRGTSLDKIYPGLFLDTLSCLKNVGLTAISENLAITAILGDSE